MRYWVGIGSKAKWLETLVGQCGQNACRRRKKIQSAVPQRYIRDLAREVGGRIRLSCAVNRAQRVVVDVENR